MRESGAHARVGGKLGTLLWSIAWEKKRERLGIALVLGARAFCPLKLSTPGVGLALHPGSWVVE